MLSEQCSGRPLRLSTVLTSKREDLSPSQSWKHAENLSFLASIHRLLICLRYHADPDWSDFPAIVLLLKASQCRSEEFQTRAHPPWTNNGTDCKCFSTKNTDVSYLKQNLLPMWRSRKPPRRCRKHVLLEDVCLPGKEPAQLRFFMNPQLISSDSGAVSQSVSNRPEVSCQKTHTDTYFSVTCLQMMSQDADSLLSCHLQCSKIIHRRAQTGWCGAARAQCVKFHSEDTPPQSVTPPLALWNGSSVLQRRWVYLHADMVSDAAQLSVIKLVRLWFHWATATWNIESFRKLSRVDIILVLAHAMLTHANCAILLSVKEHRLSEAVLTANSRGHCSTICYNRAASHFSSSFGSPGNTWKAARKIPLETHHVDTRRFYFCTNRL